MHSFGASAPLKAASETFWFHRGEYCCRGEGTNSGRRRAKPVGQASACAFVNEMSASVREHFITFRAAANLETASNARRDCNGRTGSLESLSGSISAAWIRSTLRWTSAACILTKASSLRWSLPSSTLSPSMDALESRRHCEPRRDIAWWATIGCVRRNSRRQKRSRRKLRTPCGPSREFAADVHAGKIKPPRRIAIHAMCLRSASAVRRLDPCSWATRWAIPHRTACASISSTTPIPTASRACWKR